MGDAVFAVERFTADDQGPVLRMLILAGMRSEVWGTTPTFMPSRSNTGSERLEWASQRRPA